MLSNCQLRAEGQSRISHVLSVWVSWHHHQRRSRFTCLTGRQFKPTARQPWMHTELKAIYVTTNRTLFTQNKFLLIWQRSCVHQLKITFVVVWGHQLRQICQRSAVFVAVTVHVHIFVCTSTLSDSVPFPGFHFGHPVHLIGILFLKARPFPQWTDKIPQSFGADTVWHVLSLVGTLYLM